MACEQDKAARQGRAEVWAGRWTGQTCTDHIYLIPEELGEGSGTPLQDSCLENPMDGGAWKAAVHGVAKTRA